MTKERFVVLDSWRGVCALLVVLFHLTVLSHAFSVPFIRHAWLFVDFFFALSGFVISHAYQDRLRTGHEVASFMVRRFGRVWPLHVTMLVLMMGLECVKLHYVRSGLSADRQPFTGAYSVPAALANLSMVQAMPFMATPTWNTPSWSIGVEFWTYLIFALVACACSTGAGLNRPRSGLIFLVLFVTSLAAVMLFRDSLGVLTDFGLLRCVAGFVAGHFAYRLRRATANAGRTPGTGAELAMILLVILFVIYGGEGRPTFAAPLVFGIAVWLFAHEGGSVSRLMRTRPFRRLGELSFSIYMVHWFLRDVLYKVFGLIEKKTGLVLSQQMDVNLSTEPGLSKKIIVWHGLSGGDLIVLVFLCVVLAMSAVTYRLIELPGQRMAGRYARKLLDRGERARAAASPLDPAPL